MLRGRASAVPIAKDPVGFLLLDPGPGEHDVLLRFETPLENRVGQAISVLALLAVAIAGLAIEAPRAGCGAVNRIERVRGVAYAAALLWLNAYVCRDWLYHPTAWMNSLHGRVGRAGALERRVAAPVVVAVLGPGHARRIRRAAAGAGDGRGDRGRPPRVAPDGGADCLGDLLLRGARWRSSCWRGQLRDRAGYSALAGLFYSLLSPAQLLVPDGSFSWANFLSPHRFNLQAVWDETPRCAALTFLLAVPACFW